MFIYKVTNKTNGKVYIGKWQGNNVTTRWKHHLKTAASGKGFYFHNAIRKYGEAYFTMETIASATTKEELIQLERRFIAEFEATNPDKGYNLTKGGEGGFVYSGERNPFFGKHHTEETKKKLQVCGWMHRGKKCPPGTGERISKALKGRIRSEEHSRHISEAKTGKSIKPFSADHCQHLSETPRTTEWKNRISIALKGRIRTEETRRRISEAKKAPVIDRICPVCATTFSVPDKVRSKKYCSCKCVSFITRNNLKKLRISY